MTLLVAAGARGEQPLPEAVSSAILKGDSLLEALRHWRGLTQVDLAASAGLTQSCLSAGVGDCRGYMHHRRSAPPDRRSHAGILLADQFSTTPLALMIPAHLAISLSMNCCA